MANMKISAGVAHTLPSDVKTILSSKTSLLNVWEDITPLARNEWICWIASAKMDETRNRRIKIMSENLLKGKRRPCCWIGCPHRKK